MFQRLGKSSFCNLLHVHKVLVGKGQFTFDVASGLVNRVVDEGKITGTASLCQRIENRTRGFGLFISTGTRTLTVTSVWFGW